MDQMLERTDQITTAQMPEIQIQIAETQAQPQFGIMLHSVQQMALDDAKLPSYDKTTALFRMLNITAIFVQHPYLTCITYASALVSYLDNI